MSSFAASKFSRILGSQKPEALIVAITLAFVLAISLPLRLIAIHDYVDDVEGAIMTDEPPVKLISEDQYLISRAYRQLGERVERGELLVQLDGAKQRVGLSKLEQSLESKQLQLKYDEQSLLTIQNKLAINRRIVDGKIRLARIEDEEIRLAVELDAKGKKAAGEIERLSERILAKTIPALDSPAISQIEKAKILSTAHSDLRQMHQVTAEAQANIHKREREGLRTEIEVAELQKERSDLELSHTDAERGIAALRAEIGTLVKEREQINDALTRLEIRSPTRGTVIRVSPNLQNANLVEKAEELYLIQHEGSKLEAELVLTDEQYKDVKPGQKVNLELYAWNHYKHGAVRGTIFFVSKSKVMPQMYPSKSPIFVARARIDPGQSLTIQPGYSFKARVMLEKISLFEFILKKIRFE
ncbi:HlyD family efflux transporter periplasmic adaptor subunit [Pseudomonas sp. CGJS7]|uniref:HlyD family efflux transporter periplasmic adaptor subunit n=1 Tax=Pseudomonas sp. CGJS7 TaxID=3109348 RepID=UPI0030085325